jgi:hypothetical protein
MMNNDAKVFAICLVTRNQVLVNNNVGVEVEYLFLEGEPQEIDRLLSLHDYASEEDYINYLNASMWMRKIKRSRIMKVLS